MPDNHGISTQIIKGPLAVSDAYPALVVDATGREVAMFGLAGDTARGGAVLAKTFVRLFNETEIDLTGIEAATSTEETVEDPADDEPETARRRTRARPKYDLAPGHRSEGRVDPA